MAEVKIYLAGGMSGLSIEEQNSYRQYIKRELMMSDYIYKPLITNPVDYFTLENPCHKSEREPMEFDLDRVRKSDLIIVNFNNVYSLGTMAEIATAYERKIPILGLNEKGEVLHPWQIEMCNRIFDNIQELIDYTIKFYLN